MKDLSFYQGTPEELAYIIAQMVIERLDQLHPTSNEQTVYLTRREASELLQFSLPTLEKYTKSGLIPSYRIGAEAIRYKKSELEDIVNNGLRFKHKRKGGVV